MLFHQEGIFAKVAPLYAEGLSLRDIAREIGISKSSIRKTLLKGGICLRETTPLSFVECWRGKGRRSTKPPYGFCYLHGKIIASPSEYDVLLFIHKLWTNGATSNAISHKLNDQKLLPRKAKVWNPNSVKKIILRFEKKQICIKGRKYVFQ